MTLYQAIERPLRPSHGKEGVSGSSPLLGFTLNHLQTIISAPRLAERGPSRTKAGRQSPARSSLLGLLLPTGVLRTARRRLAA